MKLLICLSAFTFVCAIRVPNIWTDNNIRNRNVGYRNTAKRNLDKNHGTFNQPVISNDGWIPIPPSNAIRTNHKQYRRPPVAVTPKFQKNPYQKYTPGRKPQQFSKKYAHNKNFGAIPQPYLVYNPFVQNENRLVLSTPRAQNNFDHLLFPSSPNPVLTINTIRPAPLSNHQQATVSINNFLHNLNVDQFLSSPQQVTAPPQLPINNPTFENFQVESVFHNNVPKNHKSQYAPVQQQHYNARRPPTTNYRDDRTHEPIAYDPHYDQEKIPEYERKTDETAPISSHEVLPEIPTKPIYPGEGKWAKRGQKHKPYVSKNNFENLKEGKEKPDGYEVFEQGQIQFDGKRDKFFDQLNNFPTAHKLESGTGSNANIEEKQESSTNEEDKEEFVPTRLYAQVRNSENEEHLPSEEGEDGRLKELIKDSKVQTVYSEEGYEDTAYDHAGHEKKAQDIEGFEETDKELEKEEEKKRRKRKKDHKPSVQESKQEELQSGGDIQILSKGRLPTDEEIEIDKRKTLSFDEDSNTDFSQYVPVTTKNNVRSSGKFPQKWKNDRNDFRSEKETKTTTTMETGDHNIEMEINGERRVILQPGDSTKFQHYVKKYPTIRKIISEESDPGNNQEYSADVAEISNDELKENSTEIYIEEVFNHTTPASVLATEIVVVPEIINLEIPITTLATTAIPKTRNPEKTMVESESLMNTKYYIVHPKKRIKRSSDDYFPDISPDVDFIDKISHELGKPKEETMDTVKYPYYHDYQLRGLHENSPLRYSEDMGNIPKKRPGQMAFYDQAESKLICPEIATTVEPIPERVLNAEQYANEADESEDEEENEEDTKRRRRRDLADSPRLSGLGDKINCLKNRYFGDNPLDSPFFKEDTVGEVKPIFKVFKNYETGNAFETAPKLVKLAPGNLHQPSIKDFNYETAIVVDDNGRDNYIEASELNEQKKFRNTNGNVDYVESVSTQRSDNIRASTINSTPKNIETTTILSLITTPNYTIELKPRNIYDQIQLLDYLPKEEQTYNNTEFNEIDRKFIIENNNSSELSNQTEQNLNIQSNSITPEEKSNARKPKQLQETEINETEVLPEAEKLNHHRRVRLKPKRPLYQIFDINKFLPTTQAPVKFTQPTQPPQQSHQPFRHYYATKRPSFQLFDVNKFLPTTTPISIQSPLTVLPKYKVISEVFYKDDIKPNEQLNVLTDVIRNIKSSSEENAENDSESSDITEATIPSTTIKNKNIKYHVIRNKKHHSHDNEYDASVVESSTTPKPPRIQILKPYKSKSELPIYSVPHLQNYKNVEDKRHRLYVALTEAMKKQKLRTTSEVPEIATQTDYSSKATDVMGLKPPKMPSTKENANFKRDSNHAVGNFGEPQNKIMNRYFVLGMRPPPMQKVYVYSDFVDNNYLKEKNVHSRKKRAVSKPSYALLSRGRTRGEVVTETTTEKVTNDDDYTPHRSRNYYYDEKLGKIVYLNTKKPSDEEEEEEVEEVYEIVEEVTAKPTNAPKQNPIFATATPPPEGQSFVDFVKKLKSSDNYQEITDPVPTEQSEETSQIVTTTVKSDPTKPPEFLSILAKLKNNNEYKLIEDKTEPPKAASKVSPATEATEIDEEAEELEEEEEEDKDVQNSSGKQIHEISRHFEIFDITDYIPKIKNYLPKTSIDTSKYQTIQRQHKSNPEENEENETQHKVVSRVDEKTHSKKEDTHAQASQTVQNGDVSATENVIVAAIIHNAKVEEVKPSTDKTIVPSTTQAHTETTRGHESRHRGRGRFKNTQVATTSTTISPSHIHHTDSTHLRGNRRRINRLRPQSTTEKFLFEESEEKAKIVHRRSDANVKGDVSNVSADSTGGGNSQIDQEDSKEPANVSEDTVLKKDVEIFREYDKKKKHGGNYRREEEEESKVDKSSKQKASDVEVLKPYNKQEQTGGSYKDEDEDFVANVDKDNEREQVESKANDLSGKSTRINLLAVGDEKEINWRHDNIIKKSTPSPKTFSIKTRKPNKPKKQSSHSKYQVFRLTDVVPKPETYFEDPSLPSAVNLLIGPNRISNEEAEEIAATTVESLEDDGHDRVSSGSSRIVEKTTKKPLFIKDPSKRLYFYAPI